MSDFPTAASTPPAIGAAADFPLRQVHLDFHTSPYIDDVGTEFDAAAFARTMKRAHVNSVTVFARCHHGMCYYPSKVAKPHPALRGRDLLGEMLEALRRESIRCPVYTTVAWDEDVAQCHPEWRMMRANGVFARAGNGDPTRTPHPGAWHFNDWVHAGYQDYLEAHTRELFARYGRLDGLFYDIVFYDRQAHYSAAALEFRARHGFQKDDDETFYRFQAAAQAEFARRFTGVVKGLSPEATVFYNSTFDVYVDGTGARPRIDQSSHVEVESLPSGLWGYFHFPRLARSAGRWGKPWLGMTGRFQKSWGDFGGIKPQPALEYECFRAQALGGGNSIGDQLPPRGTPDAAAYALIGAVYAQCAAAELFYAGSEALAQVAVLTANHPSRDPEQVCKSDEGAVQMCEETHYEASVVDERSDFGAYELLVLPDDTVITPGLHAKLKAYHEAGGRLVLSYRAGCDAAGRWALDFLPLRFNGAVEKYPTFWRARPKFSAELSTSDRVAYFAGMNVEMGPGIEVLVDRVLPYFRRTDLMFSSHFQTPPIAKADAHPAVVAGHNFVYFAEPIFREYRQFGNTNARNVWRLAMERLIGAPHVGAGLPTTILGVPRRRGTDLIVTLLHYVPVRKAIAIDVLEERMGFAGEVLRFSKPVSGVRMFGEGTWLPRREDGGFDLPVAKGRLLLEVPGYFGG